MWTTVNWSGFALFVVIKALTKALEFETMVNFEGPILRCLKNQFSGTKWSYWVLFTRPSDRFSADSWMHLVQLVFASFSGLRLYVNLDDLGRHKYTLLHWRFTYWQKSYHECWTRACIFPRDVSFLLTRSCPKRYVCFTPWAGLINHSRKAAIVTQTADNKTCKTERSY